MWGLGFSRMVLENAIATNKRLWASGESNCDCVEKRKRGRESESEKAFIFDTTPGYIFYFMNICKCNS